MSKFFVPAAVLTPADQLRESLGRAERWFPNLRGAGAQALDLCHLFDQIAAAIKELGAAGVDVRAEQMRFEMLLGQLRRHQGRFLAEVGAALPAEREHVQPSETRWWWFLDQIAAQQRRRGLVRALGIGLGVVLLCVASWWVYDRFIAPPPHVRQAIRRTMAGENLVAEGDLSAAVAEFEAAAVLTPDDPDLWVWRGVLYRKLGQHDDAEAAFEQAHSLYDTEADFLLERGVISLQVGDLDAAQADAEALIAEAPQSGWGYYARAGIMATRENYAAALSDLDRAIELADQAGDTDLEALARMQRATLMQLSWGQ
ncbi:MAG TPA: tetratricopeptide repeat protein [Chloroflexi bacterium]|nr:tetratricopeptide repeat protein [Chloroflexota bacterium]